MSTPSLPKPQVDPLRQRNVSQRFGQYSATVIALAGGAGTHAGIVYSNPADVVLTQGNTTRVGFLTGTFGAASGLSVRYLSSDYIELVPEGGSVNATARDTTWALSRLSAGASIAGAGGTAGWGTGITYADYRNFPGYPWNTNADGTTGYVGVRLSNNGTTAGTYYGWLRMTYDDASNSLTLHDFAYETTANLAITAVPEPAATGILAAMGASGLAAWRRLRGQRKG